MQPRPRSREDAGLTSEEQRGHPSGAQPSVSSPHGLQTKTKDGCLKLLVTGVVCYAATEHERENHFISSAPSSARHHPCPLNSQKQHKVSSGTSPTFPPSHTRKGPCSPTPWASPSHLATAAPPGASPQCLQCIPVYARMPTRMCMTAHTLPHTKASPRNCLLFLSPTRPLSPSRHRTAISTDSDHQGLPASQPDKPGSLTPQPAPLQQHSCARQLLLPLLDATGTPDPRFSPGPSHPIRCTSRRVYKSSPANSGSRNEEGAPCVRLILLLLLMRNSGQKV